MTTNEIKGLKTVFRMDAAFQRRLKLIWGGDKLNHTSINLEMISQDFLDLSRPLSVSRHDNPTWHRILTKSAPKFMAWLERSDGRFNKELDEKLSQGKNVNLENQAHNFRDPVADRKIAWEIACLWVDSLQECQAHNTAARFQQYREQFAKGLLDADLRPHCVAKDPDFRHGQLRFARPSVEQTMALGMAGDMDDQATTAAQAALAANLHNFEIQLKAEVARVQIFQAAQAAWETKTRIARRTTLDTQHQATLMATNEEASRRFQFGGFSNLQDAQQFATSALQRVADMPPAIAEDQVIRLNVIDLSKFGQHHSRVLEDLRKLITDELREHPVSSCFIILPPHFTKFGDTMEAGPSRDVAIQKARGEAFRSLTELQTNALVRECMWLWDRASMGESTRELTVKFHILISNQCYAHGGQVKSLIIRSSLWRWKALPSLVAPMPRANYRHWGAEVDTFGAGSFGNIERRFWNSGRSLYSELIQTVVANLKLTPLARCQVRDWSLWADEAALGVMDTQRLQSRTLPSCFCVGSHVNFKIRVPSTCRTRWRRPSSKSCLASSKRVHIPCPDMHRHQPQILVPRRLQKLGSRSSNMICTMWRSVATPCQSSSQSYPSSSSKRTSCRMRSHH